MMIMKYIRLICIIGASLISVEGFTQGQITRATKQNELTVKNKTQENSVEVINGIKVIWNGVTSKQKNAIIELIKNMVFVDGGTFMMGNKSPHKWLWEEPYHSETVNSFYLSKYEVTYELWNIIMGESVNSETDNIPSNRYFFDKQDSQMPIIRSWNEWQKFISKLNRLTGIEFRMPTEIEWEFAARGGAKSKGYEFSGSNDPSEVSWHHMNIHSVGQLKPNELGLYDMSGNAGEWTSTNSPDDSSLKMLKGYAHDDFAATARPTARYRGDAEEDKNGLRLAQGKISPSKKNISQESSINTKEYNIVEKHDENGLAIAEQNGKYGFIDKEGKVTVPFIYDSVGRFSEGVALVRQKGKYGFIDETGKVVIPLIYDYVTDFYEGVSIVTKNEEVLKINKEGSIIEITE